MTGQAMTAEVEGKLAALEAGLAEARRLLDRLQVIKTDRPRPEDTYRDLTRWLRTARALDRELGTLMQRLTQQGAELEALAEDIPLEGQTRLAAIREALQVVRQHLGR